jgi:glycosyltransferase involved in cell wall biosynthesis
MVTVSVLMPVYNVEHYVGEAVESILCQTFKDFELVAIDDGSTDRSADVVRRYACRDDRIRFIAAPHRGITSTRNEALNMASGKYIAAMDADDISKPERLAKQVAYLDSHRQCVLVGCRVQLVDPAGRPLKVVNTETTHAEIDSADLSFDRFIANNGYMACRETVCEVGGYREAFPLAEDRDLYLRLAERGRLAHIPEVLYMYRQHLKNVCRSERRRLAECVVAAVRDACGRRGVTIPVDVPPEDYYEPISDGDIYRVWAWWALGSGQVSTARKHALASLFRLPWSAASWRLLYCAMRGY